MKCYSQISRELSEIIEFRSELGSYGAYLLVSERSINSVPLYLPGHRKAECVAIINKPFSYGSNTCSSSSCCEGESFFKLAPPSIHYALHSDANLIIHNNETAEESTVRRCLIESWPRRISRESLPPVVESSIPVRRDAVLCDPARR